MSAKKQKRREEIGGPMNDPKNIAIGGQPVPMAPQGPGNIMNYPASDFAGQMGQQIGDGAYAFPYGDLGQAVGPAVEPVQKMNPSGQPQNAALYAAPIMPEQFQMQMPQGMVMGQKLNSMAPYGGQPQPPSQMADEMESARLGQNAAMKGTMPSPMGPGAMPGAPIPAQVPGAMPSQAPMMQGMPNAEMATQGAQMGMATGRGGGRNKQA